MKQNLGWLAAAAAMFLAAPSSAHAASTAQQKMAAVQYLVGTWSCTHTVGTFSGTYKTTFTNSPGNLFLTQTYDFPPGQFDKEPGVQGQFIMGYDEPRQAWVRFGAMSTGRYFGIRMTDTENGWAWKYVSFFPRTTPETPEPDATFTKKSDTEYVVDGPTYPKDGAKVTEHHVCKKL